MRIPNQILRLLFVLNHNRGLQLQMCGLAKHICREICSYSGSDEGSRCRGPRHLLRLLILLKLPCFLLGLRVAHRDSATRLDQFEFPRFFAFRGILKAMILQSQLIHRNLLPRQHPRPLSAQSGTVAPRNYCGQWFLGQEG